MEDNIIGDIIGPSSEDFKLYVSFILDSSGSMASIIDSTIANFNEYIESLEQKEEEVKFVLTKFNDIKITTSVGIRKLSKENYVPEGLTPLYDAVMENILKTERKVDSDTPVLVVIMTDGLENASKEHNKTSVSKRIKELQEAGSWTFTYLGANQDAWGSAQAMGISQGNTKSWEATRGGTEEVFMSMSLCSDNFIRAASEGTTSTSNFFQDEEDE